MATSLTAIPVRWVGTATRYTGLPKIPLNTPVSVEGDKYPISRYVRRASVLSSTVATPTWIAQAHSGSTKVCLVSAAGSTMSGYTVDPTAVDWPNVTRTYQRPRNPNGGIAAYGHVLGDGTYNDSSGAVQTQADLAETRQPLLTGLNTWTVANKLPPLTPLNLVTPAATHSYASGTLGAVVNPTALLPESPKAFRYLGGSISVSAVNPNAVPGSITVSVWAIPIDPGTLTGGWAGRGLLGTFAIVPMVPNGATYTQAQVLAAGVVRWDQYWLVATGSSTALNCTSFYNFSAPLDVPPPYDCPGVDSFIPGGLLA